MSPVRCVLSAVLVAFLATACGQPPTTPTPSTPSQPPQNGNNPPPPPPLQPPKLSVTKFLAFGDSMTAGTTSPAMIHGLLTLGKVEGYPYKLYYLLLERYADQSLNVWNAGYPGERAVDAGGHLDDALRETTPEVVLLMHGANDMLGGAPVAATADAVRTLIKACKARGAKVLLATLPPQHAGIRQFQPGRLEKYNAALIDIGTREEVTIVDLYSNVDASLIGVDGLHPTEAGYQRIAEVFRTRIRETFEIVATAR